jgi:hypothetical protein
MKTKKKKRSPMSAAQYQKALDTLGLSQRRAALHLLNCEERTSRHWALGTRPVPNTVANFLRYLIASKTSGDQAIEKLEA